MSWWLQILLLIAFCAVTGWGVYTMYRNYGRLVPADQQAATTRPLSAAIVLILTAMQALRVYNDPTRSLSWYIFAFGLVMTTLVLVQTLRQARQKPPQQDPANH